MSGAPPVPFYPAAMRLFLAALALLAALGAVPPPALALESAPVVSPRATATLAAEAAAVAPDEPFRIGLRLRLAPGWHTYWKNAGDAGAPPEIMLRLPEGAAAGPIEWPAPQRIPYGPLVNFGYQGEVLLPLRVTPPAGLAPGGSLPVEAEATWLVCEQICIPETGRFRLDLPVAAAARPDPALAPLFAAAEAAQPRPAPWAARVEAGPGRAARLLLDGPGLSPATVREAFFFPDAPDALDHAAPQRLTVRVGGLALALTRAESAAALPGSLSGVLAITDGGGRRAAFALAAPVAAAAAAPAAASALWQAIGLALLGGLLLNLMPCVFPVLAMKALGLARLAGAARGAVRREAMGYTLGVVAAFAALGGLLLGLRAAGAAAGWGFQFTAPAFVAGMAWLMLAVGLNLAGVYALGHGGAPVAAAANVAGGIAARRHGTLLGSAATGVLAVLLATPCTAPFMAAAIGAALAMDPAATLAVFLALGLGLAAPSAALAAAPGLARALPRPGPWMERLRQGLAFPMFGAAAWLVWVLAQQAGPDGVLVALLGGVLVGFGAWALGAAQRAGGVRAGRIGAGLALAAALAATALLPGLTVAPSASAAASAAAPDAADGAEPWSEARLAALRAEGRPVFVNATAAWCLSCQVNERVALRAAAVRAAFAAGRVAYLKADWTRGDPAVGALLRAHGREGVPLYLIYPADGGPPEVLPQILTEGIVLRALAAAGVGGSAPVAEAAARR
ncbi:thio:disulfide interchange protein [Caldovatus sediminis]|uniref:Thio:disulfide interchange protein n=1 Tax=Caldovatus sediminis TaxID=2041189 RepID=A0A8J2ZDR3_9PROT|nr:protein-disulfide reductase DsbD domain-containing protein [Caldovatus sediminis]GGG42639.1 thio:disulfide interchange protein [Caldovatus sediminis]